MPHDRPRPDSIAPCPLRWTRLGGAISITSAMIVGAISPPIQAAAPTEVATATAATDDPLAEVQRHLGKAGDLRQQGLAASAADHLEAAFHLLADARRWRDARGQVIAKAYETLLEAYNQASTSDEKVRHVCRLRGLLQENIAGLREAFGDEASGFPEVRYGEQKITSVELTIRTHGDPEQLCAAPVDEDEALPTMPSTPLLLGAADTARRAAPEEAAAIGPEPEFDAPALQDQRRRARRITASGGVLLVAGGALLGVMSYYIRQSYLAEKQLATWNLTPGAPSKGDQPWDDLADQGEVANTIAYATGFVGGAALVTGIALTAVGTKRLRRSELSVAPSATPTSAGATLMLRF